MCKLLNFPFLPNVFFNKYITCVRYLELQIPILMRNSPIYKPSFDLRIISICFAPYRALVPIFFLFSPYAGLNKKDGTMSLRS